jgi:hypothetical protein
MSTSTVTPNQSALGSAPDTPGPSQVTLPAPDPTNQSGTPAQTSPAAPPQPQSRLQTILGAVARVGSTALAGIPDKGRESFATGLGEGARAENAAQATQQDIKFNTFDDSLRAATLHNQDLELQARTQEQQDAHQKAQAFQSDFDEAHGINYDPHPSDGAAVMDTLKGQTAATGSATIPAGTHLSADTKSTFLRTMTPHQPGCCKSTRAFKGL